MFAQRIKKKIIVIINFLLKVIFLNFSMVISTLANLQHFDFYLVIFLYSSVCRCFFYAFDFLFSFIYFSCYLSYFFNSRLLLCLTSFLSFLYIISLFYTGCVYFKLHSFTCLLSVFSLSTTFLCFVFLFTPFQSYIIIFSSFFIYLLIQLSRVQNIHTVLFICFFSIDFNSVTFNLAFPPFFLSFYFGFSPSNFPFFLSSFGFAIFFIRFNSHTFKIIVCFFLFCQLQFKIRSFFDFYSLLALFIFILSD